MLYLWSKFFSVNIQRYLETKSMFYKNAQRSVILRPVTNPSQIKIIVWILFWLPDTCSSGFQCYDSTCIPHLALCDAVQDCPGFIREDEVGCGKISKHLKTLFWGCIEDRDRKEWWMGGDGGGVRSVSVNSSCFVWCSAGLSRVRTWRWSRMW